MTDLERLFLKFQ